LTVTYSAAIVQMLSRAKAYAKPAARLLMFVAVM
jgi:hypothetical protein